MDNHRRADALHTRGVYLVLPLSACRPMQGVYDVEWLSYSASSGDTMHPWKVVPACVQNEAQRLQRASTRNPGVRIRAPDSRTHATIADDCA